MSVRSIGVKIWWVVCVGNVDRGLSVGVLPCQARFSLDFKTDCWDGGVKIAYLFIAH